MVSQELDLELALEDIDDILKDNFGWKGTVSLSAVFEYYVLVVKPNRGIHKYKIRMDKSCFENADILEKTVLNIGGEINMRMEEFYS